MTRLLPGTFATPAIMVATATPAAAQTPTEPERYVYWPHMMGWDGAWYGAGPIMMIIWLGLAIAIIVLLVRAIMGPWRGTAAHRLPSGKTALDILKERFARGEIDKAEFEDKRRTLGE